MSFQLVLVASRTEQSKKARTTNPMTEITNADARDFAEITRVWEAAVRATHHFLKEEDFTQIKSAMSAVYLPAVELFVIRREEAGDIVAFAGIADTKLEMLFVDPTLHGKGVGTRLLRFVMEQKGVTSVDVNEQNEQATTFYLSRGFHITSRDKTDPEGRPYPILHLSL